MRVRLGDTVRVTGKAERGRRILRWVVVGFYQWAGPQMVRLRLEGDDTVSYEAPETDLLHIDDAVVRLGRLAP